MPQPPFDTFVSHLLANRHQYADRAKQDILSVTHFYKNLNVKLEPFVFNDGQRRELVCLDGTIPVSFKGVTYNIPVCIWLLDTYPYNCPMCYVKPTNDMQIKTSAQVDGSGRISLPYLQEWTHNSSDLLGLIQIMIIVFGELPPVYSKPRNPQTAAYSTPYPSHQSGNLPYPSYPVMGGPLPNPHTIFPGYMPASGGSQSGPYPGYPPTGVVPYPAYPPQQQSPASPVGSSEPLTSPSNSGFNMGSISDEQIRISILSAVEDKLKKKLKEVLQQSQAEMEVLRKTQDDLNPGKTMLQDIIGRLDREQMELQSHIQILSEKDQEMEDLLSKIEGPDNLDIDDTIDTTTPLYKQLLSAFAEESATEDTIYYTSEALRKGVIDLDVFLKNIRELSRKQFELRALMQICRSKAGLSC